jgi:hypothetical protein
VTVAAPHRYGTIVIDGRELPRPFWSPSEAVLAERRAALARRFFLVRIAGNDGLGELWKCKQCRGRHPYLTLHCVERPFSGLDQCLYAIYQQAGDLAAVRDLDPSRQARQVAKRAVLTPVMRLPDLASMHPEMARHRAGRGRLDAFDVEIGGLRLGRIEQIPRTLAQKRLDQINQRRQSGSKLHIEGLEVN